MSAISRRTFLIAAPAAALSAAGARHAPAQLRLQTFDRDRVTIETTEGRRHRFTVELAVTMQQQAQGLMYRRSLPENGGMLFLYGHEQPVSMWMKNTMIPLDMLFIADDGRIVHIAERTVPQSLVPITAGQPVAAVLELNGGTANRLGIRAGDRVEHPAFGTSR